MNSNLSRRVATVLCSTVAAISAFSFSASSARADTPATVYFDGPDDVQLSGVLYTPTGYSNNTGYSAVILMHGCTGIWSSRNPTAVNGNGTPNLQNYIEKWGLKLASQGIVALVVDSYTPREPAGLPAADRSKWQNQCTGGDYPAAVDPYTTRVEDIEFAYDYLLGTTRVSASSVALLGWSQGAQSVMVETALTPRDSNVEKDPAEQIFVGSVAFYPGCGSALGFDAPTASYWRPYTDFRINMGGNDSFYTNCETRVGIAQEDYDSDTGSAHEATFFGYAGAEHHFDSVTQSWPSAKCTGSNPTGDTCAMNAADIDSLTFFMDRL